VFLSHCLLQGRIGAIHQGLGREGRGREDKVGIDHGHPGQPEGDQERDGGSHDFTESIPVGVAEKQFVVHLWTCRQNVSRRVVVPTLGVNRSAP